MGFLAETFQHQAEIIKQRFKLDHRRMQQPFRPAVLRAVLKARVRRNVRHFKHIERDRKGDYSSKSLKRRRQGPPAHVLSYMSEETRALEVAARGSSEVGYVALAKTKLGIPLKIPDQWNKEVGKFTKAERRQYALYRLQSRRKEQDSTVSAQ